VRHIDASSIIHAWDNYPPTIFPRLWEWIQDQLRSGDLKISKPAMDEVHNVAPDCAVWLSAAPATVCPVTNTELQRANSLKSTLGIQNDNYHPKGVDENDLLIIACADCKGAELVSNEAKQATLPVDMKHYKIPAVCSLGGVSCISVLDYMKSAGRSFG
jgi:hypothetical protein